MTYDEFIKKHNGVAVNYDGAAGKQCVDLATAYFNEVFGSGIKNFWYDAHHFWDLFDKNTWLKAQSAPVRATRVIFIRMTRTGAEKPALRSSILMTTLQAS